MMKLKAIIFVLTAMVACHSTATIDTQLTLQATVEGVGGDCHLPLLDFGTRQKDVDQLIGQPNSYQLYYAVDLPESFQVAKTNLLVIIQKSTKSVACTTMGPAYQFVSIVNAEAK